MTNKLIDDIVKDTFKQPVHVEPPKYVILLTVSPVFSLTLIFVLGHILVAHCGLSQEQAMSGAIRAMRTGRLVVRPCTKEIGETILNEIEMCDTYQSCAITFNFSLEEA